MIIFILVKKFYNLFFYYIFFFFFFFFFFLSFGDAIRILVLCLITVYFYFCIRLNYRTNPYKIKDKQFLAVRVILSDSS